MTNFLLTINLVLLIAELSLIFLLARLVGSFMNKLKVENGNVSIGTLTIGEQAPLFSTFDINKNKISLSDKFTEKNTILFFVNTNCSVCKKVLPSLNDLVSTYDNHFIIINSDETGDDSLMKETLIDSVSYIRSVSIASTYEIPSVPYSVFINEDGLIENFKSINNYLELKHFVKEYSVQRAS